MKVTTGKYYQISKLLISRLERLSADSIWARRASGLRGSLLKGMDAYEKDPTIENDGSLEKLVTKGFEMLEKAAGEIPDIEAILKKV